MREMLTTERYMRTNDNWEDHAESDKTWENWKEAYNKAHAKARIKAQANEGTVKFGAENSAAHLETTQNVEKNQGVEDGGMKALEGYFTTLPPPRSMKDRSLRTWWRITPSLPPQTRT